MNVVLETGHTRALSYASRKEAQEAIDDLYGGGLIAVEEWRRLSGVLSEPGNA